MKDKFSGIQILLGVMELNNRLAVLPSSCLFAKGSVFAFHHHNEYSTTCTEKRFILYYSFGGSMP
jgi:hypothetical protein